MFPEWWRQEDLRGVQAQFTVSAFSLDMLNQLEKEHLLYCYTDNHILIVYYGGVWKKIVSAASKK